jgi:hypothetical protein
MIQEKTTNWDFEDEYAWRGCYAPSYLYMQLGFKVERCLTGYSPRNLGTVVHEYTHFLQNLTTPWGLYSSWLHYKIILKFFYKLISDKNDSITIPVPRDADRDNQVLCNGNGSRTTLDGISSNVLKIDDLSDINFRCIPIKELKSNKIILDFKDVNCGHHQIELGAWIIKESMAAMIQRKIDPESYDRHPDIPYKLVELLCNSKFPSIASDPQKLYAICYASLFSMNPGYEFTNIASDAVEHPEYNAEEILNNYVNSSQIKINGDQLLSFADFYSEVSKKYLNTLSGIMNLGGINPICVPRVINQTQFVDGVYPLLFLYTAAPSIDDIEGIMDDFGTPAILGINSTSLFPYFNDNKESSQEIVFLIGIDNLFRYLTDTTLGIGICPMLKYCQYENVVSDKCYETPWDRDKSTDQKCILFHMANILGINKKTVKNYV